MNLGQGFFSLDLTMKKGYVSISPLVNLEYLLVFISACYALGDGYTLMTEPAWDLPSVDRWEVL